MSRSSYRPIQIATASFLSLVVVALAISAALTWRERNRLELAQEQLKRIHVFERLFHEDGFLSATSETLLLHIDMAGPKVAPIPDDLLARLTQLSEAHASLPADERIGRSIAIRRKS